jgi:CO/xanthine dehydrogenase FAD-binding subunit
LTAINASTGFSMPIGVAVARQDTAPALVALDAQMVIQARAASASPPKTISRLPSTSRG